MKPKQIAATIVSLSAGLRVVPTDGFEVLQNC